ncbi:hypothetical protein [Neorhizobium sp. DT-125]|uniref:hypothetical protein n=1 Tax=Neorhizobium sp. DT-125 TaxID=3396163 RepID=UPI003F1D46AD
MLTRLIALSAVALPLIAGPALSQTSGSDTPLPGVTKTPDADSGKTTVTPPPGVTDPMTTNSTTGTIDHEDHCQPPGTPSNTNPSAGTPTLPRPEPACN